MHEGWENGSAERRERRRIIFSARRWGACPAADIRGGTPGRRRRPRRGERCSLCRVVTESLHIARRRKSTYTPKSGEAFRAIVRETGKPARVSLAVCLKATADQIHACDSDGEQRVFPVADFRFERINAPKNVAYFKLKEYL